MASLMDKLKKTIKVDHGASVLSESKTYDFPDVKVNSTPILNVAFSSYLDKGMTPGVTVLAGESGVFKTNMSLLMAKAFQDTFEDGIIMYYDSENGATAAYFETFDIDISRVLHIPIINVEELKFNLVSALDALEKGEKVFILVDSIGNLASKKEVEDAINEKSVADMTRAKAIKSLFRIITPLINLKGVYSIFIAHTYKSQNSFVPTDVVAGGTGLYYSGDQIFIITRAKEKEGSDLIGFKFTMKAEKSRFVKKDSKFTIVATYDEGVHPYSGLAEIALEGGFIEKYHGGSKYTDEEGNEYKVKTKLITKVESKEFWDKILEDPEFKEYVHKKYRLTPNE